MIPSRYNILLKDQPEKGSALIFNSLSGALYELEPDYVSSLEKLGSGGELTDEDRERLNEMATEGFVAQSVDAEKSRMIHKLRKSQHGHDGTLYIVFATTMACNLKCVYCMEREMGKSATMTPEIVQAALEKITELAEDMSARRIAIDFYGGEPLLTPEIIEDVSRFLKAWCEERGMEYLFTMTSNGVLLTPELVQKLKPLGFKGAKVTLDGPPELHDSRRPMRQDGSGSFDTIIKNLEAVIDDIDITLVTVYSEESIKSYEKLLDILKERGLLMKFKSIQPGPEAPMDDETGCIGNAMTADSQTHDLVQAYEKLLDRGYTKFEMLAGASCPVAGSYGKFVFSPEGVIHKCPALMGKDEYSVGDVMNGFSTRYDEYPQKEIWRDCVEQGDCPYPGVCGIGAGCRLDALSETGELWGNFCSRKMMDVLIPKSMVLEHRLQQIKEEE